MDAFPARIGAYVPERLLGRGAMAAVYLCRDTTGEPCAVKWLDHADGPLVERFARECRALSEVRHPGVVGHRAHGTWQARPWLAMDYVEGTELRVYIDKLHRRPPAERYARCRAIGVALCEALEHLHERGMVHRDVKPTNVLIADDDRVLLSDLGVVQHPEHPEPCHGVLVGTPAYAAPEQADGAPVDHRADLFGLGATLYHVLTRRRPFESIHRTAPAPSPSRFDPGIPADLEAIVARLMAPDPAQRFASASAVAEALGRGREEGVRVAGRQDAVSAAAQALSLAEDGGRVLVVPLGPQGNGRGWLVRLIVDSALRRGIRVVTVGRHDAWDGVPESGPVVVVSKHPSAPQSAPESLLSSLRRCDIAMPPLGAADVRRTVVGFAPDTPEPAQVSAHLHRLTGGLPALLVPLLQAHTQDGALRLPDPVPPPPVAWGALRGVDDSTRSLAAALAMLDRPASESLLEQVVGEEIGPSLNLLEDRGLVRRVAGRAQLAASLFRTVALADHPDPSALRARMDAARTDDPTVPGGSLRAMIDEAVEALCHGRLATALHGAERAAQLAAAVGDRTLECRARCTLGRVLLEAGHPRDARRCLADATALARAVDSTELRYLSHALRAWAELDERPGDPGAAAAALDRLLPLVARPAPALDDGPTAVAMAVWARSAAALRDRGAWRRAAEGADARIDAVGGELGVRLRLLLAEAAVTLSAPSAAQRLQDAGQRAAPWPLLSWWAACLSARFQGAEPPAPGALVRHLDSAHTDAIIRRGARAGR